MTDYRLYHRFMLDVLLLSYREDTSSYKTMIDICAKRANCSMREQVLLLAEEVLDSER